MGEPIDLDLGLDLVELRAKVRGWPVLPGEDELCVETPHGDVWVQADGTAYSVFASADSRGPRCPVIALLTAPRWTLARLLESPPNGWRALWRSDGAARFDHAHATVWFGFKGEQTEAVLDKRESLSEMAAAARDVADLLAILAEVQA